MRVSVRVSCGTAQQLICGARGPRGRAEQAAGGGSVNLAASPNPGGVGIWILDSIFGIGFVNKKPFDFMQF
jgi:hypothetical protein